MAKILIVEDDASIHRLVRMNLELVGHQCTSAFDGEEAVRMAEDAAFDLLLLDVMLPRKDGFTIAEEIVGIPIIFLTAKGDIVDRVRGLRMGAHDYIVKPFDMMELQARVDGVLRRTQKAEQDFALGDVRVHLEGRQVYVRNMPVDFTPQEFALIETLIRNRNIALSREKLLEIAWGYDYMGETRTVDVHIHNIRRKLGWEDVIKTVYKLGYRLEVQRER